MLLLPFLLLQSYLPEAFSLHFPGTSPHYLSLIQSKVPMISFRPIYIPYIPMNSKNIKSHQSDGNNKNNNNDKNDNEKYYPCISTAYITTECAKTRTILRKAPIITKILTHTTSKNCDKNTISPPSTITTVTKITVPSLTSSVTCESTQTCCNTLSCCSNSDDNNNSNSNLCSCSCSCACINCSKMCPVCSESQDYTINNNINNNEVNSYLPTYHASVGAYLYNGEFLGQFMFNSGKLSKYLKPKNYLKKILCPFKSKTINSDCLTSSMTTSETNSKCNEEILTKSYENNNKKIEIKSVIKIPYNNNENNNMNKKYYKLITCGRKVTKIPLKVETKILNSPRYKPTTTVFKLVSSNNDQDESCILPTMVNDYAFHVNEISSDINDLEINSFNETNNFNNTDNLEPESIYTDQSFTKSLNLDSVMLAPDLSKKFKKQRETLDILKIKKRIKDKN